MKYGDRIGKIIFTAEEIASRISQIAEKIENDHLPGGVNIMPILNGACHFYADLSRKIRVPMKVFPAFCESYEGAKPGKAPPKIVIPQYKELPKKLLVVEDILDTGRTLTYLGNLLVEAGVEEVKICVLLHKKKVSQDTIFVEHVAFACPKDFVIGYGLDYLGEYRNLPDIHILKTKVK